METLFFQVHKAALVGFDHKLPKLQVRAPLLDGQDNCQIFLFIGGQAFGSRPQCLAKVGNWVAILLEHRADAILAGIHFDHEGLGEIR